MRDKGMHAGCGYLLRIEGECIDDKFSDLIVSHCIFLSSKV